MGEDGETHHGLFDLAYLNTVPHMTLLAPASFAELKSMLERAVLHLEGPVAVRYPRGGEGPYTGDSGPKPACVLRSGEEVTLVGYGVQINELLTAAGLLEAQGVRAEVVKLSQLTPLVPDVVERSVQKTGVMVAAEECAGQGCVGERLAARLEEAGISAKILLLNCGAGFVTHGKTALLKEKLDLDGAGIARRTLEVLKNGKAPS